MIVTVSKQLVITNLWQRKSRVFSPIERSESLRYKRIFANSRLRIYFYHFSTYESIVIKNEYKIKVD